MARDDFEPIAHVVQAYSATITRENARTNYEDVINIIESLISHADVLSDSPAEKWRYKLIHDAIEDDLRVCGLAPIRARISAAGKRVPSWNPPNRKR